LAEAPEEQFNEEIWWIGSSLGSSMHQRRACLTRLLWRYDACASEVVGLLMEPFSGTLPTVKDK